MNVTEAYAAFASGLKFSDLDPATVENAKIRVLDYLASAMAGQQVNRAFDDLLYGMVSEMGGKEDSSVLFYKGKLPAANAALLNGAIGHGADIDDGHRMAQGHPGTMVIPAILALAEKTGASGRDILTAITVGFEIFVRLGMTLNPYHVLHGGHTSGTAGAVAVSCACANLLKLGQKATESAIGFGGMQAAGLMQVSESGQASKGMNTGKAASNGVFAALLAATGAESPTNILEGRKGFLKMFAGEYSAAEMVKGLGEHYLINDCYVKLYPACRHMHGCIQIGREIYDTKAISPEEIASIKICIYQAAINLTGNIDLPKDPGEGKFALKYALATAMCTGNYTLKSLDPVYTLTPQIARLVERTAIENDDSLEDRARRIRGTRVEFTMRSGEVKTFTVLVPKGDPEDFVSETDLRAKFAFCAEGFYDQAKQDAIYDAALSLDSANDVSGLFRLLKI